MSWNIHTSAILICTVINLDSFWHLLPEIWKMNNVYIYVLMFSLVNLWYRWQEKNFVKIFYNYDFFSWNTDKKWGITPQKPQ